MKTLVSLMEDNVGQVRMEDAQQEIDRLNDQQKTNLWHQDDSPQLFCPNETDEDVYNSCELSEGYVWITRSYEHIDMQNFKYCNNMMFPNYDVKK